MDLTAACAQVEQASRGLAHPEHRAAAEATLLEFRRSPHALAACRHILDTSAAIEAQFQAAATLRDAALRDWNALPPTERANLRQHCLHLILQ
jgi:geranylgeranyl pyrophosphate synthase